MTVPINAEKVQAMIHYLDNVRVSNAQRERINCLMLKGILIGEMEIDELMGTVSSQPGSSNVPEFLYDFVEVNGNEGEHRAQELYEDYVAWCMEADVQPESLTRFGMEMARGGILKIKRADANHYLLQRREASA